MDKSTAILVAILIMFSFCVVLWTIQKNITARENDAKRYTPVTIKGQPCFRVNEVCIGNHIYYMTMTAYPSISPKLNDDGKPVTCTE